MAAGDFTEQIRDPAGRQILSQARRLSLPAGRPLFRQGDACENYLLVIDGSVKVFSRAENGREILLYRVQQQQSCTLTTACLLANNRYPAESITETQVNALMIGAADFNRGLQASADFRQLVFDAYAQKLTDIISLVEQISFGRIDIRLARALLQHVVGDMVIHITHHSLAAELGTAREVVSRQLKEFEHRNWLKLQRGSIEILDSSALEELAQTPLM
jgi:CRP/FNR family transcriptional regulator